MISVHHQHKQDSLDQYADDKLGTSPTYVETSHELFFAQSLQTNLQLTWLYEPYVTAKKFTIISFF